MAERLKVLASVYACDPYKGSEPGVGWNWVKQIARFHDVWVITRANNREPIESALARELMPNVHWVYFDLPRWSRFWKKGQRGVHLYYYLWQIGAYFAGRRLHKEVRFDLVHHVTFGVYCYPSFLVLLPVPFFWGPVGGGDSAPEAFYSTFSLRGRAYEYLRNLGRWLGQCDPFVWLTCRRTVLALANTADTKQRLWALGCKRVLVYSHMGALLSEAGGRVRDEYIPFRVASIGRLVHWKGFHLGLIAFAKFQQEFPESEYWLIGDGPERKRLEQLACELGVFSKVRFWGASPRPQVLERLRDSDVLVHPALHDSAPGVCLEAMAAECPVICLDLGGPALQVTEETGFKVRAISPQQVVNDLAEAMRHLAQNPLLRKRMGNAARERVMEYFDWDKKGDWIRQAYQSLVLAALLVMRAF
jgi:glycosyltransferase involved in cell wall biosynthesis